MLIRDVSFLHFFLLTTRDIKRPRHYCGTWIDRWRILFVARRSSVAIPARLQAWMVHNHTETKCHMCVCFDINTSWCCYKEYTPKAFLFEPCCAHAASIFGKKLEVVVRTRIGLHRRERTINIWSSIADRLPVKTGIYGLVIPHCRKGTYVHQSLLTVLIKFAWHSSLLYH